MGGEAECVCVGFAEFAGAFSTPSSESFSDNHVTRFGGVVTGPVFSDWV